MRAWIALFGLLFQVLLPLVHPAAALAGHAVRPADAALLCTAQDRAADGPDATDRFTCPDCELALPPLAPPPRADAVPLGPVFALPADPIPADWPVAVNPRDVHPGNPRAPPLPV